MCLNPPPQDPEEILQAPDLWPRKNRGTSGAILHSASPSIIDNGLHHGVNSSWLRASMSEPPPLSMDRQAAPSEASVRPQAGTSSHSRVLPDASLLPPPNARGPLSCVASQTDASSHLTHSLRSHEETVASTPRKVLTQWRAGVQKGCRCAPPHWVNAIAFPRHMALSSNRRRYPTQPPPLLDERRISGPARP